MADEPISDDISVQGQEKASHEGEKGIDIGSGWIFSGDVRAGWLEYDYQNPSNTNPPKYRDPKTGVNQNHVDSQGFYIIPKLSIESPVWNNFQAKVTGAAATDFGLNNEADESRNFVFNAADPKSYAILQEAYLSYGQKGNHFVAGRKEVSTPMIDSDDWYMLANSFEVAYYLNDMYEDIRFGAGYFHKMAGVWDSGAYDKDHPDVAPKGGTDFYSMSQASFVADADKHRADDKGISVVAFDYDAQKHHVQLWNYMAYDLYNTFFAQYDFKHDIGWMKYDFGLQYINFHEVGVLADHNTTNINYSLYSARYDGSFPNGIDFATGISKYTDGEGQGATLGAFGGYPYFANGMIFHFFEAGSLRNASSYKAQVGFDLSKVGIQDTWIGYRHTFFNLDPEHSQNASGQAQDSMHLNGIRVSYGKKQGAYFTGTYEHVDLDQEPNTYSLRLIGGYRF